MAGFFLDLELDFGAGLVSGGGGLAEGGSPPPPAAKAGTDGGDAISVTEFGGFASGQLVMFQQMGFGVAIALLVDATLIRMVVVPALMAILGRWNWYLPSWLGWLPEFHVEGDSVDHTHTIALPDAKLPAAH